MRYFFHIAYHGQNYNGWQKQPDGISVQAVLEDTLFKVLKTPTAIYGCGRTDAQVNASQYFFHADLDLKYDFDLLFRLNKTLPDSIAIYDIIQMEGKPHARFDAIQRIYDYYIHTYKDPFLKTQSSMYLYPNLDLQKMAEAVKLLPQYNDYAAYCTSPNKNEHTICNVSEANLYISPKGDRIRFNISSNRFLGKMIRILTGKLLNIGTGKLSIQEFEQHLISRKSPKTLDPAYPSGLYLSKIVYPYLDLPVRTELLAPSQNAEWLKI